MLHMGVSIPRLYTGYFSHVKHYNTSGIFCVSIASRAPVYYYGCRLAALAPTNSILKLWKTGSLTEAQYADMYNDLVLSKLDPQKTVEQIYLKHALHAHEDCSEIVLLCYEATSFCHRHLAADWLNRTLGLDVHEFQISKRLQKPKTQQRQQRTKETVQCVLP